MTEKKLLIEPISPARFFGPDNTTFKYVKQKFPRLKISSRGSVISVSGSEADVKEFETKFSQMISFLENHPKLDLSDIDEIVGTKEQSTTNSTSPKPRFDPKVLVYGPNGKIVKVRTQNQQKLVDAVDKNDIVFAVGPAGTGKTYTAVALAVRALKNKEVKRIILARPAVEAGESLGFLPGDLKEKIDPYLKPLYDSLQDMIPLERYNKLMETGVIEIVPMAFMRGRTLDNCFVILDEAQNATQTQLKMFLTRMGPNAKVIITGDLSQVDLPPHQRSGLYQSIMLLKTIRGIKIVELDTSDVIRHKLVKEIIQAYDDHQKKKNDKRQDEKNTD